MNKLDENLNPMNVVMDYCYNEFLKMCDFLQQTLTTDKQKFIQFVLAVFTMKTNASTLEQLIAQEKFKFPEPKEAKNDEQHPRADSNSL